jgi:putative ABC transport system ATP-binding protein
MGNELAGSGAPLDVWRVGTAGANQLAGRPAPRWGVASWYQRVGRAAGDGRSAGPRLRPDADNPAMLFELERVSLSRGGAPVLHELSASLPEGVAALVGPSGSGKSTALRLLNRLSDPDSGTVWMRGEDTLGLDPLQLRRRVALVPQLPALLDGTLADNLRFAAGLAGRQPNLDRCLELAGLASSFAERNAAQLSIGEQQRAMIARSLALEPEVLLLDEPTSALDAAARSAVERTIAGLRKSVGASIVIVTHDPDQARRLADWTVEIDGGHLVRQGATGEVLA